MANKQLFINNFNGLFVASVKDTPVTGTPTTELDYGILRLSDGVAGALLNPTGGDYYVLTSYKKSGTAETSIEIMRVTNVDNSVPGECRITVLRAQEGTAPQGYVSGDYVGMRWTKGGVSNMLQAAANLSDLSNIPAAKTTLALENVSNTSDANKPVSTAQAAALGLKEATANKDASGGYAGMTLLKLNLKNALGTITNFLTNATTTPRTWTLQNRDGTLADDTDLALKANLASPTFTGTVGGITKTMVGLPNVDNTADASKPVSTAQLAALDLKQNLAAKDATGGYAGLTLFALNMRNVANTFTGFLTNTATAVRTWTLPDRSGTLADDTDLLTKANLASPTFTGVPAAPTAAAATNTTQLATTAFVTAALAGVDLSTKANIASPVFTGTPAAPTAAVGANTTQLATTAHVFAERANAATLTNKTLTNPTNTEQTLVDAATTAWNMDLGHVAIWAIGATGRTLAAPTNYKVGGQYQLLISLATPATMTPTWPAIFKFPYDTAPDLTTSTWTALTLSWSTNHSKFLVSYGPGY